MRKNRSMTQTFLLNMILVILINTAGIGYFWVSHEYERFDAESRTLREKYVESQKAMIRHEVERAIDYIRHKKAQAMHRLRASVREKVDAAHSVATNIYEQNRIMKTDSRIMKMIRDALRPVRFNSGRGYFFAASMDGTEELYPPRPDLEGKNLLSLQDAKGKFVIQDEIRIVREHGKGFAEGYWPKPGMSPDSSSHKVTYVRHFKPFGWFIGTWEFLDDVENDIQKEVLEHIVNIRFGKEGYLFASTYNGDPLFSNGKITQGSGNLWNLTDPNGVKLIQEQRKVVENPEGGFVSYMWRKLNRQTLSPKISFSKGFPDWEWMVGAGVYVDDIEKVIRQKRIELENRVRGHILKVIFILTALLFVTYLFAKYLSHKIQTNVEIFSGFFENAAVRAAKIEQESLYFSEFKNLAGSANQMVDERIQAQESLQESEARFRQLANASWEAIAIHDKGRLLLANEQYFEMFGYPADELLEKQALLLTVAPESLLSIKEHIRSGNLGPYEITAMRKNGERFPAEIRVRPLEYQGSMVRVAAIRDMTETRKAQEAFLKSEDKFSTIFKSSPDSIVMTLLDDGSFIDCNDNFLHTMGYDRDEVVGKTSRELEIWENSDVRKLFVKELEIRGEVNNFESSHWRKDGSVIPVLISSRLVSVGERPCILSIARNMTDYKKAEQEKQELQKKLSRSKKMEALGLLAGGVAHDLNNILSGIVSYPELILMDLPKDHKLRKPIETIQNAGLRAAEVVQDLVTMARGIASAKRVMSLNLLVREYLNSLEFRELETRYSAVRFKTSLAPDILNISCSSVHIKKSLMNLVVNASEAIQGSGSVRIATENRYVDTLIKGYDDVRMGEYAMLTVSDDGPGISPTDIERIFEPFYTKKVMGRSGTGLGLAIVWNTVQDHKGYINVQSSEKGTVFELYFPITREDATDPETKILMEAYMGGGERILVVDDEADQRKIACGMLNKLGYAATAVSSGEAALAYMREDDVDLIILDMIMLPGMNGRETYEQIIRLRPGQKAIIASGFAETDDVREAQKLGAGQYVRKPYTIEKMGIAVRDELKKAGSRNEVQNGL